MEGKAKEKVRWKKETRVKKGTETRKKEEEQKGINKEENESNRKLDFWFENSLWL